MAVETTVDKDHIKTAFEHALVKYPESAFAIAWLTNALGLREIEPTNEAVDWAEELVAANRWAA